jgi:predicted AAA+ superfamily ATPase
VNSDEDLMFSALADWNPWWRGEEIHSDIIGRDRTTPDLKDLTLKRREIKTVTGIRRCGKSTLLYQMIAELLAAGVDGTGIVLVNFDDDMLGGKTLSEIMAVYRSKLNPVDVVNILLDEVHRCPDWVGFLRKAYDLRDVGLAMVTDSSSRFIKGEYATLLTGRTIDIRMHPLSFAEFVRWHGMDLDGPLGGKQVDRSRHLLETYLRWGGFPEVVLAESDLHRKILLKEYLDSILYKDVVERYNANIHKVKVLVDYLISTPATRFSPRKFSRNHDIALEALNNYIGYLDEVNLVHLVPKFDFSLNKVKRSTKKVYLEDTGLFENLGFQFMEGKGKLYENAVCLELKRRGFEVYYWSDGTLECDFIAKRGKDLEMAVQVCYQLSDENTAREIRALETTCNELKIDRGFIVSSQVPDVDAGGFEVIPLWRFLLEDYLRV